MAWLVEPPSTDYGDDFIDAVGKLKSTVLDVDRGVAMRHIAAVNVSDA